jgi:hypothetical protein
VAAFDPVKNYSHTAADWSGLPRGRSHHRLPRGRNGVNSVRGGAANTVGFYDINLMDATTGDVVYTVVKETDFGSNMYNGAFTQSGFARVAKRALDPRNGGKAVIEDYHIRLNQHLIHFTFG